MIYIQALVAHEKPIHNAVQYMIKKPKKWKEISYIHDQEVEILHKHWLDAPSRMSW